MPIGLAAVNKDQRVSISAFLIANASSIDRSSGHTPHLRLFQTRWHIRARPPHYKRQPAKKARDISRLCYWRDALMEDTIKHLIFSVNYDTQTNTNTPTLKQILPMGAVLTRSDR